MKTLREIFLSEQDEPIEIAGKSITIFPDKEKNSFLISPSSRKAKNLRSIINQVKQRFDVIDIQERETNSFEIFLGPNQDLDEVTDFLQKEIARTH